MSSTLAFIGGGNMASAIIGGLLRAGHPAQQVLVIEPAEAQRARLHSEFDVRVLADAGSSLAQASLVVWAVKPQLFREAAAPCAPHVGHALHLSVMAGIRSDALVRATHSERVVRAMPNTPALIGRGMAGLYARPGVDPGERPRIEQVLASTGELLWFEREEDLDAVTALSGSGPAYVFYFVEAMIDAAQQMGLSTQQARQLALGTFAGATELARQSSESPGVLRERVTSKGGTTHAALSVMQAQDVAGAFIAALHAARKRARELGDEFG
jgi:pyrroline-5-carboxylate reductase